MVAYSADKTVGQSVLMMVVSTVGQMVSTTVGYLVVQKAASKVVLMVAY